MLKRFKLKVRPAALKKCANLNEKKLRFTSAGYKWQFVNKKRSKYVLQKGELSVKTVGKFGTLNINFPDY